MYMAGQLFQTTTPLTVKPWTTKQPTIVMTVQIHVTWDGNVLSDGLGSLGLCMPFNGLL